VSTILVLLIAADPFGFARVWPDGYARALGGALVLALSVGGADPALDLLDLSPPSFWIAAGLVLLVPAFGRLVGGTTRDVAGPAGPLVAMSLATRDGTGITFVAVAIVLLVAWVAMATVRRRSGGLLERVIGAAMVVVAFDLVRDGVIAV
jgi:small neutral amino acid transporter SnatA (MarC family)